MIAVDPSSIPNEALTVDWLEAGPWIMPWADNTVFRLRLGSRQQKKRRIPDFVLDGGAIREFAKFFVDRAGDEGSL